MTRRSGPSPLEAAVYQWAEAVLSRPLEEMALYLGGTQSLHAVSALSEEAEARVLEIGRHLAAPSDFRSRADLVQFLYDSVVIILGAAPDGHRDTAHVAARLVERLANPLQQFSSEPH